MSASKRSHRRFAWACPWIRVAVHSESFYPQLVYLNKLILRCCVRLLQRLVYCFSRLAKEFFFVIGTFHGLWWSPMKLVCDRRRTIHLTVHHWMFRMRPDHASFSFATIVAWLFICHFSTCSVFRHLRREWPGFHLILSACWFWSEWAFCSETFSLLSSDLTLAFT